MDILVMYLDNIFASLPATARLAEIKTEMLANMEDRYRELLGQGHSGNEAAGLVISEFGNIRELIQALGLEAGPAPEAAARRVSLEEVKRFAEDTRQASLLIARGVALCIIGAALLVLFASLGSSGQIFVGRGEDFSAYVGLVALFLCVAPAVMMFVRSGFLTDPHEYLEKECFVLEKDAQEEAARLRDQYAPYSRNAITFGVTLCVLSPMTIFITAIVSKDEALLSLSVVALLALVAAGVYLLIRGGMAADIYKQLLQVAEFSCRAKQKGGNELVNTVAGVVWPLATAIFLLLGFVWGLWHPGWVIFPITGVLFGAFTVIAGAIANSSGAGGRP